MRPATIFVYGKKNGRKKEKVAKVKEKFFQIFFFLPIMGVVTNFAPMMGAFCDLSQTAPGDETSLWNGCLQGVIRQ